jgi:hypothetical protein
LMIIPATLGSTYLKHRLTYLECNIKQHKTKTTLFSRMRSPFPNFPYHVPGAMKLVTCPFLLANVTLNPESPFSSLYDRWFERGMNNINIVVQGIYSVDTSYNCQDCKDPNKPHTSTSASEVIWCPKLGDQEMWFPSLQGWVRL